MEKQEFDVLNVKCGGCVSNIQKGLSELSGVSDVQVTIEGGHVVVEGQALDRVEIGKKLASLGYPER
jgi:copper chaperone